MPLALPLLAWRAPISASASSPKFANFGDSAASGNGLGQNAFARQNAGNAGRVGDKSLRLVFDDSGDVRGPTA